MLTMHTVPLGTGNRTLTLERRPQAAVLVSLQQDSVLPQSSRKYGSCYCVVLRYFELSRWLQ
jgi:hypothetical protein